MEETEKVQTSLCKFIIQTLRILWMKLTHNECLAEELQSKVCGGVQPAAHRLHAAQHGCECGPTQNRPFT